MEFETMVEKVAEVLELTKKEILSTSKKRRNVEAKHILYLFLRTENGEILEQIGERFKQNHATVLYGLNVANGLLEYDKAFKKKYEKCKAAIDGN